ncbi:carcinoembryonic antigen-related cell adhesion molecule 6 [Lates calcarifer]|uniref:Carcinoembryonic antigen-related cell adhesion molecule 6 n=1 Tax=Lates calcarifer TaxID=8187 RepID=A0AAJ7VI47_LATCA|nr:carcinoembryonic antigen-related cell adhesion molecule 6 [Lates calcarifer]
MVTREIFLHLLFGHLFIAFCSQLNPTTMCTNDMIVGEFEVTITASKSDAVEGDDITLTCKHNLGNVTLTFGWRKDGKELQEHNNKSELFLKNVLLPNAGQYICYVNSTYGCYKSPPHKVTVKSNSEILLVICGVSALALVVIMGLIMKFKLKRDNAKHRQRMAQRAQNGRNDGPAPITPRES